MLERPTALPLALIATLTEDFDGSALPWKVGLIDRRVVADAFGAMIDANRAALLPGC